MKTLTRQYFLPSVKEMVRIVNPHSAGITNGDMDKHHDLLHYEIYLIIAHLADVKKQLTTVIELVLMRLMLSLDIYQRSYGIHNYSGSLILNLHIKHYHRGSSSAKHD